MTYATDSILQRCTAQCRVASPLGTLLLARSATGLAGAWFDAQKHHPEPINAPERDVYERIFNGMTKRLGMTPCPEAVDYLYERYYTQGRSPRASDCRDLLEIVQSICRFRKQPVHLTRELMIEAANTFICEFK
jgi:hypothetical protein